MNQPQSHENCSHESNKAARAKCRRQRAKFNAELAAVLGVSDKPASAVTHTDRLQRELDEYDENPGQMPDEDSDEDPAEAAARRAGFESLDAMIENDLAMEDEMDDEI